jgi:O-succinylbenzoate synthase
MTNWVNVLIRQLEVNLGTIFQLILSSLSSIKLRLKSCLNWLTNKASWFCRHTNPSVYNIVTITFFAFPFYFLLFTLIYYKTVIFLLQTK